MSNLYLMTYLKISLGQNLDIFRKWFVSPLKFHLSPTNSTSSCGGEGGENKKECKEKIIIAQNKSSVIR